MSTQAWMLCLVSRSCLVIWNVGSLDSDQESFCRCSCLSAEMIVSVFAVCLIIPNIFQEITTVPILGKSRTFPFRSWFSNSRPRFPQRGGFLQLDKCDQFRTKKAKKGPNIFHPWMENKRLAILLLIPCKLTVLPDDYWNISFLVKCKRSTPLKNPSGERWKIVSNHSRRWQRKKKKGPKGQKRKKKDIWTARQVNHDSTSRLRCYWCSHLINYNSWICTEAFLIELNDSRFCF